MFLCKFLVSQPKFSPLICMGNETQSLYGHLEAHLRVSLWYFRSEVPCRFQSCCILHLLLDNGTEIVPTERLWSYLALWRAFSILKHGHHPCDRDHARLWHLVYDFSDPWAPSIQFHLRCFAFRNLGYPRKSSPQGANCKKQPGSRRVWRGKRDGAIYKHTFG